MYIFLFQYKQFCVVNVNGKSNNDPNQPHFKKLNRKDSNELAEKYKGEKVFTRVRNEEDETLTVVEPMPLEDEYVKDYFEKYPSQPQSKGLFHKLKGNRK